VQGLRGCLLCQHIRSFDDISADLVNWPWLGVVMLDEVTPLEGVKASCTIAHVRNLMYRENSFI